MKKSWKLAVGAGLCFALAFTVASSVRESVTVEELAPYLDAAMIVPPDLLPEDCSTNFYKLPARGVPRNDALEELAMKVITRFKHNTGGDRLSTFIPIEELDEHLRKFVGDSPWGLFNDPRLQKGIAPYLEAAKAEAILAANRAKMIS